MMKRSIIFLTITFLVVLLVVYSEKNKNSVLQLMALESAKTGWNWVYNNPKKHSSDLGSMVMVKLINDKYCQSEKVDIFWKEKIEDFEDHSYLSVFERFFSDEINYKISENVLSVLEESQAYYNEILPRSLYCDQYLVPKNFVSESFANIENEEGYDLTHLFWSAILFRDNGCAVDEAEIEEIILKGAQRMVEVQEKSIEIDDLYVERMAFLFHYGFGELVKEKWVEKIIENQKNSGAWSTPSPFGGDLENSHTTVLAILALTEYSGACPF